MISFIFFALVALIDSFIDTLVFRSGKSIFPESWSPFKTYSTVPLTFGLIRLDTFHITKYVLQLCIILAIITHKSVFGIFDIAIFFIIWGVFFEGSWRLFYRPKP